MDTSTTFPGADIGFKIVFGICVLIVFVLTSVILYFVFHYSRKKHPVAEQVKDNNMLELSWTAITGIIILLMFYFGYSYVIQSLPVPGGQLFY